MSEENLITNDYSDLPFEIVEYVFEYLLPNDLLVCSQVCRKWFEVTQLNKFNRKISLLVASFNPLVDTDWSPILNYKDSLRTEWPNIIISNMEIEVVPKFLEDFGSSVRELVLDKCQINEKTFYGIIPQLNNLELLDICNCPDLFMYGFMNKNYDKSTMIIETLQVLKLRNNSYISDATFCNIMTLAPNIHTLDLSGSCLNFHTALYKKYYPSHIKELSVNVFNYKFVIDFIMKEASKLKQLNLSNTLLNGDALIQLGTVNNLQIETISLNCCAQLTNHGVINFVEQQRNLQHLDVSNITRLTDIGLIQICTILTQLKSLKLKRCRAITNIGLEKLVDLRQLEYLDISECSGINGDGITNGIGKEVHNKLREFHAGCTLLCNRAVKAIAVNFLNLRVLNLTSCRGVTDTTIQLIFVNLIYLRELYVDYCEFVTDASLMGIQLNEQSTNNSSLETNSNAVSIMNPSNPFRIPLGSRAENDITREATRKRIFDEMLLKGECDSISGVSIANLRGLHHLSLSYCKHITNVSLEYSLRFSELKSLNLKSCEEITAEGVKQLVNNCKSLEKLDLSECLKLEDNAIEFIAKGLKRLRILILYRCVLLTDKCLDFIITECRHLRTLDIRGCRRIQAELHTINELSRMSCLRELHFSKPGPYLTPD